MIQVMYIYALRRRGTLPREVMRWLTALAHMSNLQVVLGLATLLYLVPTPLAATHQAGSLTLLTFATLLTHTLARSRRLPF